MRRVLCLDDSAGQHQARRERFVLFLPEVMAVGLMVFVHGGYWRAFDKSDWSHLAAGALAKNKINILAVTQTSRQTNMQFVVERDSFNDAQVALHRSLCE